jgi:hypothetical protein
VCVSYSSSVNHYQRFRGYSQVTWVTLLVAIYLNGLQVEVTSGYTGYTPRKESIGSQSLGGVSPDVCSLFVRRSKNFRLTLMTSKALGASGIVCTKEII